MWSLLWIMALERGQPPVLRLILLFALGPFAFLALWIFFDVEEESGDQDETTDGK